MTESFMPELLLKELWIQCSAWAEITDKQRLDPSRPKAHKKFIITIKGDGKISFFVNNLFTFYNDDLKQFSVCDMSFQTKFHTLGSLYSSHIFYTVSCKIVIYSYLHNCRGRRNNTTDGQCVTGTPLHNLLCRSDKFLQKLNQRLLQSKLNCRDYFFKILPLRLRNKIIVKKRLFLEAKLKIEIQCRLSEIFMLFSNL